MVKIILRVWISSGSLGVGMKCMNSTCHINFCRCVIDVWITLKSHLHSMWQVITSHNRTILTNALQFQGHTCRLVKFRDYFNDQFTYSLKNGIIFMKPGQRIDGDRVHNFRCNIWVHHQFDLLQQVIRVVNFLLFANPLL